MERLSSVRDEARVIAGPLGRLAALERLEGMVDAVLADASAGSITTDTLRAYAVNRPDDHQRIELFEALAGYLRDRAPEVQPGRPDLALRRTMLPFYEAYFSTYIEGTVFTLDEAADIALAGNTPADRPHDATISRAPTRSRTIRWRWPRLRARPTS